MSSDLDTARKHWAMRNSDGRFCYDEDGALTECQSPPSFTQTDSPMPPNAQVFSEESRTTHVPVDATTTTAELSEYEAHAVLHQHVFDPSLSDPDA